VAAPSLGQDEAYSTVGEILAEASSVRPEPFGSETCRRVQVESLKAELFTAENSHPAKGSAIERLERFLPMWVCTVLVWPIA
jgi:hypothetical protein